MGAGLSEPTSVRNKTPLFERSYSEPASGLCLGLLFFIAGWCLHRQPPANLLLSSLTSRFLSPALFLVLWS